MSFAEDVSSGLRGRPKAIPCKYFYDYRGAQLFDQICRLAAYYPTRAELDILRQHGADIASGVGAESDIVELGSGAALKTRLLLSALGTPRRYVPFDVSGEQLEATAAALRREYPGLEVEPVCADFTQPFSVRPPEPGRRLLVFFPGSTIGNFSPIEAAALMARMRRTCGPTGALLVGIDLKKDPAVLHRAYNDEKGVTAAFNMNLLVRANRELGADFALERQAVSVAGEHFELEAGEPITTEYSYKYELGQFSELAAAAGLGARQAWLDSNRWFAVVYLVPR